MISIVIEERRLVEYAARVVRMEDHAKHVGEKIKIIVSIQHSNIVIKKEWKLILEGKLFLYCGTINSLASSGNEF
jgi:hypothetical protein